MVLYKGYGTFRNDLTGIGVSGEVEAGDLALLAVHFIWLWGWRRGVGKR